MYLTVHGPMHDPGRPDHGGRLDGQRALRRPERTARRGRGRQLRPVQGGARGWHAPAQNFVYADDHGNIGVISAGYYPQVAHGDPWLPLPGTGADDVAGVIPYAAEPQVYDPPGHVVATANQRPVGPSYPYYIGTSADFFDNSFRANEIYSYLRGRSGMTRPASPRCRAA